MLFNFSLSPELSILLLIQPSYYYYYKFVPKEEQNEQYFPYLNKSLTYSELETVTLQILQDARMFHKFLKFTIKEYV